MSEASAEKPIETDSPVNSDDQDFAAANLQRDSVAIVQGHAFHDVPQDLYIPPDALEVFLEAFEGPLDLLLYLIKRQNLDVLEIPIAEITHQYVEYMEMMRELRLELAADYLVMAATLAEIKSRLLLPRSVSEDDEDVGDPRAELIRRLQEYERFKNAAFNLDELPRMERDIYQSAAQHPELKKSRQEPDVSLQALLLALKDVMKQVDLRGSHQVKRENLSIRQRMTEILDTVNRHCFAEFNQLFRYDEGRLGVVVTFIAILELLKQSMIDVVQADPYSAIHIKAVEI